MPAAEPRGEEGHVRSSKRPSMGFRSRHAIAMLMHAGEVVTWRPTHSHWSGPVLLWVAGRTTPLPGTRRWLGVAIAAHLEQWVGCSGFRTVAEWIAEFTRLSGEPLRGHLFRVTTPSVTSSSVACPLCGKASPMLDKVCADGEVPLRTPGGGSSSAPAARPQAGSPEEAP